jgi:hypothetical protein
MTTAGITGTTATPAGVTAASGTAATAVKKAGAKRPRVASPTHVTATMNNANRTPITCGHLTALHYSRGNCKVCLKCLHLKYIVSTHNSAILYC